MKPLLASLLCLVFTASQCFALKGGPPYPGNRVSVVGTYAGVIRPTVATDPCGRNSIAVFSVGVPQSGVSSGTFVTFSQGRVFSGTVRGTADPGLATLKGVLNATFTYTMPSIDPITGRPTTIDVIASANGNFDSRITTTSTSFGPASTRLRGGAHIEVSHGQLDPELKPRVTCAMDLDVIGFKQSSSAPTGTN